jgi:hypothetical protein
MKLIEQYIYAIGKYLPYNSRKDIKKELYASLLDEIEATYGENPTQKELEAAITAYGTPRQVANRYKENNLVIGSGYTDLFFFISKLIIFALSIAFTIIFVIGLLEGDLTPNKIIVDIARTIARIIGASLSAIAWVGIGFIILTRLNNDHHIDLEDDWTPKDLADIHIGPEGESKIESGLSIFFILVFIVIINTMPFLPSIAENAFGISGLLGHSLNIDLFKIYLIPLSALWFGEIIYHILNLLYGTQTKKMVLFDLLIEILSATLLFRMVFNPALYLNYTSLVGFRAIILLVAIIGVIESIGKAIKFIKLYIVQS